LGKKEASTDCIRQESVIGPRVGGEGFQKKKEKIESGVSPLGKTGGAEP